MKKKSFYLFAILSCSSVIALLSCRAYSFSGTNLNKDIKSFSISRCSAEVALGPVDLEDTLRKKIETTVKQRAQLKYIDSGQGDIDFEIVIKKYQTSAEATKADSEYSVGSIQRLKIEVEVNYKNSIEENASFEKKIYSHFSDVDSGSNIEDEEPRLIKDIFEKISRDLLNDTVCNW